MYKEGDIVVIEEVGEESCWFTSELGGVIVQLEDNEFSWEGDRGGGVFFSSGFLCLTPSSLGIESARYCKALKVRKIDQPLKFRGGKVINAEEATSPF